MILSQRYKSTDILWHKNVIEEIKKHPGCCNNVWLSMLYGYPSLEKHAREAKWLTEIAALYRENGISVSLQLSNTIGHGEYMSSKDCSALVYEGSNAENMVGHDGTRAAYAFCPRGKNFKQYLLEEVKLYTPIKPDVLWVDDDFRLTYHAPIPYGCFCDDCIAAFNAENGTHFDRASLVEEMLHGDLSVREKYTRFQRKNMHDLMYDIMRVFHEGSPSTVGALEHALPGGYIMSDYCYAFDAIKDATGKAPFCRPGGGSYTDHHQQEMIEKAVCVMVENAALPSYVTEIYPEIENLPHNVFGKSPTGTAVETAMFLAVGATNMSYSMMNGEEELSFYGSIFEKLSRQRPYYERLSEINRITRPMGLRYFYSKNEWQRPVPEGGDFGHIQGDCHYHANLFMRDAIPLVFDRREEGVLLLHPAEVSGLTDEDVRYLLSRSVVTDAETVIALQKRGFDLGIDVTPVSVFSALSLHENYTDHPLNGGEKSYKSSYFSEGKTECFALTDRTGKAELLGFYASDVENTPNEQKHGAASLLLTTESGGKWAILAYQPWKGNISKKRRDRLLDIIDGIAEKPYLPRMVSSHQALLFPRADAEGKIACVTAVNCTIGKCEGGTLLIKNPSGTRFTLLSQERTEPITLTAKETDEGYLVTLPTLDAWCVATVFCE